MPTLKTRRRYSKDRIHRMRNGLLRSWQPGGAHYQRFIDRPADAETMRKRALWDRKGGLAATLIVGEARHEIRHSNARIDSYEVGGVRGGRVAIGRHLASLLP